MRHLRVPAARHLATLLAALAIVAPVAPARGMSQPDVGLALTTAVELPAASRAALIEEVEGIWRHAGFQVRWLADASRAPHSRPPLRVLVMMRASAVARDRDASWPVAELLPAQNQRQVAIASIDGARRVLAAAGFGSDAPGTHDYRLGVVLGRAVAHEVGHYLLRTSGHARSGLMRTRIDPSDFADLRAGGFYLDKGAARWIHRYFAASLHAPDRQVGRFTY